jgi:hypothetical protein
MAEVLKGLFAVAFFVYILLMIAVLCILGFIIYTFAKFFI